ncbi:MAG: GspH/FimT family pseudopilin [Paracoccaceae bacterium]
MHEDIEAGLTLVEILCVMVLAALAATLAVPMMGAGTRETELGTAIEGLRADLRRARSRALSEGVETWVTIDLAARSYARDDGVARALPPDARLSVTAAASETDRDGRARLRFYPDGTATGGVISLSSEGTRRSLAVDWFDGRVGPVETVPEEAARP